jgi:hypothetical protein
MKTERKRKIRRNRHIGQHKSVRFRRYEQLPCVVPLVVGEDPGPDPLPYEELNLLYSESKKAWDARDNYWSSLRQSQLEYNMRKARQLSEMPTYNFNMINRRKKQMFNEDEVSFIEETAKKDLKGLQIKIEQLVNEMARMGKNLSDLKVVESKLTSILRAIADDKEDDRCRGAC